MIVKFVQGEVLKLMHDVTTIVFDSNINRLSFNIYIQDGGYINVMAEDLISINE